MYYSTLFLKSSPIYFNNLNKFDKIKVYHKLHKNIFNADTLISSNLQRKSEIYDYFLLHENDSMYLYNISYIKDTIIYNYFYCKSIKDKSNSYGNIKFADVYPKTITGAVSYKFISSEYRLNNKYKLFKLDDIIIEKKLNKKHIYELINKSLFLWPPPYSSNFSNLHINVEYIRKDQDYNNIDLKLLRKIQKSKVISLVYKNGDFKWEVLTSENEIISFKTSKSLIYTSDSSGYFLKYSFYIEDLNIRLVND